MRFRFPDEKDARERAALSRRVDAWWRAFASEAPRIDAHFSQGKTFDVPGFMDAHFQVIDPRLMWEFGPPHSGGRHRLVITPECDRFLRPLVDVVLACAPRDTGFEFHAHRPAVSLESATAMVRGRAGMIVDGWAAYAATNEAFGVDLTFLAPLAVAGSQEAAHAGLVLAEVLLGEAALDTSVDAVEISASSLPGEGPLKLDSLAAEVAALLERKRRELPSGGFSASTSETKYWVLERQPSEAPDHARQEDLLVGTTAFLPASEHALSGRPFSSHRFSRAGETFCYLKIDGIDGLGPVGFQDRGDIHDALDAALSKAKLGTTIGGGTGLRYSYVELALRDVEQALPVLLQVLRSGYVPKRTWLLFHDSSLHAEWVGVWDDSPAPPLLPE